MNDVTALVTDGSAAGSWAGDGGSTEGKQEYLLMPEDIIGSNECSKRGGWARSLKLIMNGKLHLLF